MTDRTRVAAVIGNLNREHGGAQQLLYNVFANLPGEFAPVVYHMFGPATFREAFEEAGVTVRHLRAGSNFDLGALTRLVRLLRRDRPDVLQTNSPISGIWGRLAATAAGVPCIVSVEQNVHDSYRLLPRLSNGLTLPMADVVVGVSAAVVESLGAWERALLPSETTIVTIHNAIDVERFVPEKHPASEGSETRVVGTVGRLTEAKGYEYALRAWPRILGQVPGAELRIVGDGPRRGRLQALAADLGVEESVTFTGYRADPLPELHRFDVGVFPSLWEGLPLALAQAMAAGVPVVASDIDPVRALVGDAGVTVSARDPEALARELVSLLEDPDRRSRLAAAGRQRVVRRFSARRAADRYAEVYQRCGG